MSVLYRQREFTRCERAALIWYLIPAIVLLGLWLFLRDTRRTSPEFFPAHSSFFTSADRPSSGEPAATVAVTAQTP